MRGLGFVLLMLGVIVVAIIVVQMFLPSTKELDCMRMCHENEMGYYEWVSGFNKEEKCLCYDGENIVDVTNGN